jgi:hypothetical protein
MDSTGCGQIGLNATIKDCNPAKRHRISGAAEVGFGRTSRF